MGLLSVGSVYWNLLHWRDTSSGLIVSRLGVLEFTSLEGHFLWVYCQ